MTHGEFERDIALGYYWVTMSRSYHKRMRKLL